MIAAQKSGSLVAQSLVISTNMTLDQMADAINALVKQGSSSQYQIGQYYNHIVDQRLADIAGYDSAKDFFAKKVKALSQATLSAYGTVARSFPEVAASQYGMFNLRALLTYAQVANLPVASDPGTMPIDVPQEDGTVKTQPFADCTVDELERAIRARRTPSRPRVPVADAARLLFIEDSVKRHFTGVAEVHLSSRNEKGTTVVSVQNVPLMELERLLAALQEGLDAEPSIKPQ